MPKPEPKNVGCGCSQVKEVAPKTKTLYERLGGADGITQLVNDAIELNLNNPIVKTRFENTEDMERAKLMTIEFFCAGSGGPETYSGRDLLTTHRGMNISEEEFIAVLDDIFEAMDKNQLDNDVKKEVLSILYSVKSEVIRV
jgi:hemoglobin